MFKRLLNKPLASRRSFFLFGPRGTGKTTWLKHHLPDALFINLLQSEFYNHERPHAALCGDSPARVYERLRNGQACSGLDLAA